MQDALGADFTDFNRIAQPSCLDLRTDHRLHSVSGSSSTPLIQTTACRANALTGILPGRRLLASRSRRHSRRVAKLQWPEFGIGLVFDGGLARPSTKGTMSAWYRANPIRSRCRRVGQGQRAARGRLNMMIDCSCVCHWQFQNEVIGG